MVIFPLAFPIDKEMPGERHGTPINATEDDGCTASYPHVNVIIPEVKVFHLVR